MVVSQQDNHNLPKASSNSRLSLYNSVSQPLSTMLQTQQLNNAVVHNHINVMQSQSAMGQSGPKVSHHGILQQRTTQQI